MEKKWIKTEQMLEGLKGEPDVEQQYCHYLGGNPLARVFVKEKENW